MKSAPVLQLRYACVCSLALVLAVPATAASTYIVSGTLTLDSGAPAPNVLVTAVNANPQAGSPAIHSDSNGNYALNVVAGGAYTITPSFPGFNGPAFSPVSYYIATVNGNQVVNFVNGTTFTASGNVTPNPGAGLAVMCASSSSFPFRVLTTTNSAGHYSCAGLPVGQSYLVYAAAQKGYVPVGTASVSQSAPTGNVSMTPQNNWIAGKVVTTGGAGIAGVLVQASYTSGGLQYGGYTISDSSGNYVVAFSLAATQSLNLTATFPDDNVNPFGAGQCPYGYSFPAQQFSITQTGASSTVSNATITGTPWYSICGWLTNANNGVGIQDLVQVQVGGQTQTVFTNVYVSQNLAGGQTYLVAATSADWLLSPPTYTFANLTSSQFANFTGVPAYSVSGTVTFNGAGLANVKLSASGGYSTMTAPSGYYSMALPVGGNYTITPSFTGYSFTPVSQSFQNLSAQQPNVNFAAVTSTISGKVTQNGNGLAGVSMGLNTGTFTTTDAGGNYSFVVASGNRYTLTPFLPGYSFSPGTHGFANITSNQTLNFAASPSLIRTAAGGGPTGYPWTQVGAGGVFGVVQTPDGSKVYASWGSRIYAISHGTVSVLAGTGVPCYYGTLVQCGNNVPAMQANLDSPGYLALDGSGNVYFSDSYPGLVRKVNVTTGVISTIAEGLNGPGGIVIRSGVLYVTEANTDIVGVNLTSGTITNPVTDSNIVANAGLALNAAGTQFYYPYSIPDEFGPPLQSLPVLSAAFEDSLKGVALDSSGNVYVAGDTTVWAQNISGGSYTTFAGSGSTDGYNYPDPGTFGFGGDGGQATQALLNSPNGLAVGWQGGLWIADSGNNRVRFVDTGGNINTLGGNGSHNTSGDGGPATSASFTPMETLAVDLSGNIYIADGSDNRVRKVSAVNGYISTIAGTGVAGFNGDNMPAISAQLGCPSGLAVDAYGNIYIADQTNNRIRTISASTGNISTVAGNGSSGFSGDNGPATAAKLGYYSCRDATPLAVDSAGNIFLSDYLNVRVRRVDAVTGYITTIAGGGTSYTEGALATSVNLNYVTGLAVDGAGTLYIADEGSGAIRKVSNGVITTVIAQTAVCPHGTLVDNSTWCGPLRVAGLAADPAGNLYFTAGPGTAGARVFAWSAATQLVAAVAGTGATGYSGDGGLAAAATLAAAPLLGGLGAEVALDANNNLYIADGTRIRTTAGTVAIGGSGATPPSLKISTGHIGNFYHGESGAVYNISVSNSTGAGSSSGDIVVADSLPTGLTLLGMSGSGGWNCFSNSCTYSGVLTPGASAPPITVSVSVQAGASQVMNQVGLSGGGSDSVSASDPTTILAASPCNVTHGVSTTVSDVQHEINEALGAATSNDDLNVDHVVSVVDVQIVINAVLGPICLGA